MPTSATTDVVDVVTARTSRGLLAPHRPWAICHPRTDAPRTGHRQRCPARGLLQTPARAGGAKATSALRGEHTNKLRHPSAGSAGSAGCGYYSPALRTRSCLREALPSREILAAALTLVPRSAPWQRITHSSRARSRPSRALGDYAGSARMLGSAAHAAFTSCLPTCWTYVSPAGRGRADHIAVTLGDTPDADDHQSHLPPSLSASRRR